MIGKLKINPPELVWVFKKFKKYQVNQIADKTGFSRDYVSKVLKGQRHNNVIMAEAMVLLDKTDLI